MKKISLILMLFVFFIPFNVFAKVESTTSSKTTTTTTTITEKINSLVNEELGIKISANMDDECTFNASSLDETSELYDSLNVDKNIIISAYNVELVGNYKGKINVSVNVNKELTGRTIVISYIKEEKLKKINAVAYDGVVSFEIDELTPFMLSYTNYENITGKKAPVYKKNILLIIIVVLSTLIMILFIILLFVKKNI